MCVHFSELKRQQNQPRESVAVLANRDRVAGIYQYLAAWHTRYQSRGQWRLTSDLTCRNPDGTMELD